MSVYNGEKYLKTQLDSIAAQQQVRVALTVRDDASTDRSCKIIEAFRDQISGTSENDFREDSGSRIPLTLLTGENLGAAGSFLELVKQAEDDAEYYAFSDQDDYWMPEKLFAAVQALKERATDPEGADARPALYYSNVHRVGANLEELTDPFKKNYHTEEFGAVLIAPAAPGCTMVFNRALLLLLKSYQPRYLFMHDCWTLQVCAALGGTIIYDENSYIRYRQHQGNVIGSGDKMKLKGLSLLKYRIQKLFDRSYSPQLTAAELERGYGKQMSRENRKLAAQLAKSDAVSDKWRIICSRKLRTPYFAINMKFWLYEILGEFDKTHIL
jgi:rhamnosyltransferase